MKKSILILVSAFVINVSFAQEMKDGASGQTNNKEQRRFGKMAQELNLTEEQKTKMKSIGDEYKKKLDELETQQTLTVKQYNDKKTALRKEMMAKREAVLTKDQKDKMATLKSEREKKLKETSAKRLEMMKKNLSLTDDQEKKIKPLQEKMSTDVAAVYNDNKLNDQEKKVKIGKIREEFRKNTGDILTEDQKNKMKELVKNKSKKS